MVRSNAYRKEENAVDKSSALPKRFNLNLSPEAHTDMVELSRIGSRSMSEIFRLALGLLKVVYPSISRGGRLMLIEQDGTQREIVLPK